MSAARLNQYIPENIAILSGDLGLPIRFLSRKDTTPHCPNARGDVPIIPDLDGTMHPVKSQLSPSRLIARRVI